MYTIVKLDNPIQHYAWGSLHAIAELQGRASPAAQPEAELWIGDHPRAPSGVLLDGGTVSLREWIARDPDAVLGPTLRERYGSSLPFLVKLLAAARALSIQVHPNAKQAKQGCAREQAEGLPPDSPERNYCDGNPKRELLIALTPFSGLCGFRADAEAERLVALAAGPVAGELLAAAGRGADADAPPLAATLLYGILQANADLRRAICREMHDFGERASLTSPEARWVSRLCGERPQDATVIAPLLLNLLTLEPGQGMVVTPGTIHCYLEGFGVEVMSCSDNVIRGGLTSKRVDIAELQALAFPRAAPPEIIEPEAFSPTERRFPVAAPEFEVKEEKLTTPGQLVSHANGGPRVLLCVEGRFQVEPGDGSKQIQVAPGEAVLLPACVRAYRLRGRGRLFSVTAGEEAPETG